MVGNLGFRPLGLTQFNVWNLKISEYEKDFTRVEKSKIKSEKCVVDQSKNVIKMLCVFMN